MADVRRCFQQPYNKDEPLLARYRQLYGLAPSAPVDYTTNHFRGWWGKNRGRW